MSKRKPAPEYLTVKEVADRLRMSQPAIYRLAAAKQIPFYRFNRKAIRFDPDELAQWEKSHRKVRPA